MKRLSTLVAVGLTMVLTTFARETSPAAITPMRAPEAPGDLTKTYVTEPEGTMQRYAISGYFDSSWGLMDFAGVRNDVILSDDGTKAYFNHLIVGPGVSQKPGTYVMGDITTNEEGKRVITIKAHQLMRNYDTLDEWLLDKMEMTAEEYAQSMGQTVDEVITDLKWTGPRYFYFVPAIENALAENGMQFIDEFVIVENEEGVFKPARKQRVFLLSYSYEAEGSDYASADITMTKVTHSLCTLPEEGVEYRNYLLSVKDNDSNSRYKTCKVGFKDNKVYIPGLLFDGFGEYRDQYAEGEMGADGVITLTTTVFYGPEGDEYRRIRSFGKKTSEKLVDDIYVLVPDEEFDPIKLNYDASTGNISLFGEGWIIDFPYGSERYGEFKSPYYTCLDNLKLDNPAKPSNLKYESNYLSFKIPFTDTAGQEIPTAFLSWQLLIDTDDNVFEFTPDDFWINDRTTELSVNFDDPDIINDGKGNIRLYWSSKREWENLGVRSVLNFNDEKKYSEIIWLKDPTGIEDIYAGDSADAPAYDVLGRRVDSTYKGIVIRNGRKLIRR